MATTRPRPSLINLFDPLANGESTTSETPATPRHDDTDKENHGSPEGLTMTLFVNKIYKPVSHPQPTPLKRRLIDIGDMTLEDAACPDTLLGQSTEDDFSACFAQIQDDDNATLTFQDMVKAATPHRALLKPVLESPAMELPPLPRLPLADISQSHPTSVSLPKPNSEQTLPVQSRGPTARSEDSVSQPRFAVAPSFDTETIPLLPSPIMHSDHLILSDSIIDAVPGKEPSIYARASQPDSKSVIDTTTAPTAPVAASHSVGNSDSASQADSDKITPVPPIADERILPEPCFGLDTSKLGIFFSQDTSSIDSHPSTKASDSSVATEASLADMSIPIIVSESSPPSSPISLPQPSQHEGDSEKLVSPTARLRLSPPTAPECNRMSIDLHASFQMLMESEDMSFDLLSDKLSFLQQGMESFLTATEDDPSFDLEAERVNMEKALKKHFSRKDAKEDKITEVDNSSSTSSSPGPATPADTPSAPSTPPHPSLGTRQATGAGFMKTIRKRLSIPVAISSRFSDIPSPTSPKTLTRSPSICFSPSSASGSGLSVNPPQRSPTSGTTFMPSQLFGKRSSLQFTTPRTIRESVVPQMPVAVPAPKIIRRSRLNVEQIGGDSTTALPVVQRSKDDGGKATIPVKGLGVPHKAKLQAKVPETPQNIGVETASKSARRASVNLRSSISSMTTTGQGPRRVPISEGPKSKTNAAPRAVTMPTLTSEGPRRVPLPSSGSALPTHQSRNSITGLSGLKAPTQTGSTLSTTTSSLPKPRSSISTSRLPAPRSSKTSGLPALRRAT